MIRGISEYDRLGINPGNFAGDYKDNPLVYEGLSDIFVLLHKQSTISLTEIISKLEGVASPEVRASIVGALAEIYDMSASVQEAAVTFARTCDPSTISRKDLHMFDNTPLTELPTEHEIDYGQQLLEENEHKSFTTELGEDPLERS